MKRKERQTACLTFGEASSGLVAVLRQNSFKLPKRPDKAFGHFSDRDLNLMETANPIEFAAPASNNMRDRRRLLALAEEQYYLTKQTPRDSRWQHPLRRSIQAKRRKSF